MHNITKGILALATALVLVSVGIGAASAVDVSSWNGTENVTDTFTVTNDTEELRVTAENVTNDSATVVVTGIADDGTETQVTTGTVTTDAANGTYTDTYSYTNIAPSSYTEYRVEVSGDGADSLSVVKIGVTSGGAGFLSGTDYTQEEIAAGVLLAGIAVVILWYWYDERTSGY